MKIFIFRSFVCTASFIFLFGCSEFQSSSLPTKSASIQLGERRIEVPYTVDSDGIALMEGDIILGPEEEVKRGLAHLPRPHYLAPKGFEQEFKEGSQRLLFRQGLHMEQESSYWPKGIVPYEITDSAKTDFKDIMAAINHWNEKTIVKLVPYTGQSDYISFVSASGCSSHMGRRGGQQFIRGSIACSTNNYIHEIGHALGLYHEHMRPDRDSHINIHLENLNTTYLAQFKQQFPSDSAASLGIYDLNSNMHYPTWAFSKNSRPTISAKDSSRNHLIRGHVLSSGDIHTIYMLYKDRIVSGADTSGSTSNNSGAGGFNSNGSTGSETNSTASALQKNSTSNLSVLECQDSDSPGYCSVRYDDDSWKPFLKEVGKTCEESSFCKISTDRQPASTAKLEYCSPSYSPGYCSVKYSNDTWKGLEKEVGKTCKESSFCQTK